MDTSLEKDGESALKATHRDFAREIFDFLNLEHEVDVDAIARQHREEKSDSRFRSIEHWIENQGGDRVERHGNLDSDKRSSSRRGTSPGSTPRRRTRTDAQA